MPFVRRGDHLLTVLADVLYAQGRYEEAEETSRQAEETTQTGDVASEVLWRVVRAKALARRGDLETAERLAREAVDRARPSDDIRTLADTLVALAEVLAIGGREVEARPYLDEAFALYEQKEVAPATERVRALLASSLAPSDSGDHPYRRVAVERRLEPAPLAHVVAVHEDVDEGPELTLLVEEEVGDWKRVKCCADGCGVGLEAAATAGLLCEKGRQKDYGHSPTSIERTGGRSLATSSQSPPAVGET
jgi:tetratricopeptide (TPR) repeat protein